MHHFQHIAKFYTIKFNDNGGQSLGQSMATYSLLSYDYRPGCPNAPYQHYFCLG